MFSVEYFLDINRDLTVYSYTYFAVPNILTDSSRGVKTIVLSNIFSQNWKKLEKDKEIFYRQRTGTLFDWSIFLINISVFYFFIFS